jgi:hypothetical protein
MVISQIPKSVLNKWKSYLCQLLNMYNVNVIKQTEMYTADPLVPERSSFRV